MLICFILCMGNPILLLLLGPQKRKTVPSMKGDHYFVEDTLTQTSRTMTSLPEDNKVSLVHV